MGGVDKPGLYVGRLTLLDRVLRAVRPSSHVVVVGDPRPVCRPVTWTREDPVGGGPVSALVAGLEHVSSETVLLLAADLPFLDPATVDSLAPPVGYDGVVLVDGEGREQFLCSAWRTSALRSTDLTVPRLKDVVAQLSVARVTPAVAPGSPAPWSDCDTPEDLEAAREIA
jgi:molybdopterin-guanine dinucleotide biosynthesis protein A